MRIFILFMALCTFWGCKQSAKEESKDSEHKKNWFYWAVDWHPHKSQFVVGGSSDTLKLFSSENHESLKSYPYPGTITKTKWHPAENKLAVSVQDGKSQSSLINFDTDERIPLDSVSNEGARAIGWNHSGELLAVGDYEGYLTVFDKQGKVLKRINTQQKSIIGLDWHPEENLIAAVGEKITLYHYELDSIRHIDDRTEKIEVLMLCVDWHPSGKFFATGDYGDFEYHYPPLLQYWSYEGERIKAIEESKAEYRSIIWSSDGEVLASASEKLRLWDQEGNVVAEASNKNLLWGLDWNQDDSRLVATDFDGKIIFWDRKLTRLMELEP